MLLQEYLETMRIPLHNFLAGLILFLTLTSAVAAQSQPDEKSTEGTTTGKISGHVVNDAGQPLAEALVTVRTYEFWSWKLHHDN